MTNEDLCKECGWESGTLPQIEPLWPSLDSESGDFTDGWNQAIDLCRQAFSKWRVALPATPQVEAPHFEMTPEIAAKGTFTPLAAPESVGAQPRCPTVDGLAEQIAQEIWEESPRLHGNLRCWPGTYNIAAKIKKHFKPLAQ